MGVVTIFLAALLLCLTAYFEQWGQAFTTGSSLDSSAPAPQTEDPSYFEDKDIPQVFTDYAILHNSATASPMNAKYVVYEMPGNTTVAQSLFGLVRELLFHATTQIQRVFFDWEGRLRPFCALSVLAHEACPARWRCRLPLVSISELLLKRAFLRSVGKIHGASY